MQNKQFTGCDRQWRRMPGGFTMIELIVVIVVIGVLTGVAAPMISHGLQTTAVTQESLRSLQKIRYASERLAREIRQINHNGVAYDITVMSASQLVFAKSDATPVTVTINQGGGNLTLAYSTPATSATLTNQVTAFTIAYYDAANAVTASNVDVAFVEFSITLLNPVTNASLSQRTRVALRDQS